MNDGLRWRVGLCDSVGRHPQGPGKQAPAKSGAGSLSWGFMVGDTR